MGKAATACILATAVVAAGPGGASAEELALTCSVLSVTDISDTQPYSFLVRIDLVRKAIVDVDGDAGEGWVVDGVTDALVEAHFDLPDRLGGLKIDRAKGTIDMITGFRFPAPTIRQWTGNCTPA